MCTKCHSIVIKPKEDEKDTVKQDGYIMLVKGSGPKGLFKNQTVESFRSAIQDIIYPPAAYEDEMDLRAHLNDDDDEDSDSWKSAAGYTGKVEQRFIVLAYASWGYLGMKRIYDTVRDTYIGIFSPRFKKVIDEYRKTHDYLSDGD